MPVVIVRPFNTYGPRQSARAIIPTVILQLLSGCREIRLGNLNPTRDFNYIKDTVRGFVAICESDAAVGQEINIATQTEISIENLAKELIGQINPSASILNDEVRLRPPMSEVDRLLGSNEKIMRLTSWRPLYTLDAGLAKTIEWFKNEDNRKRYKSDIYNL